MRTTPARFLAALISICAVGCGEDPQATVEDVDGGSEAAPDLAQAPDLAPAVPELHPIVLVHGLSGFAKVGPLEYFAGVPSALRVAGRKVYTPALDMFNDSAARGARLLETIEQARLETGAHKVVLIGHSQGGLDARWAAMHAPDEVEAVITIATPHRGSKVADVALGLTPGATQAAASALLALVGGALDPQGNPDADLNAALTTLSTAGAAAFNAAVPDAPGVAYYSIAGRSADRGAASCPPSAAPFVATFDGDEDPLDAALWASAGLLAAAELPGRPTHDGLVTVDSAQWGTFLGCIPADHMNEICQPAATTSGSGGDYDCLAFYTGLDAWLRSQGH